MSQTPESVLAAMPEWANASLRPLPGGQTNQTWLVDAGERKAVLKIDETPRTVPFNPRLTEAQIQMRAAREGLANKVLLATDTLYMTEYAEGIVWSQECLADDANIEQLAAALKRLHALPLTGRTFDATGAAKHYARKIGNRDEARIEDCLTTIADGPLPNGLCCCHNDLVVANIINTPETRFLDWEYACDNDPVFDLATITAHHDLDEAQTDTFLNAYFNGNGERWQEQLRRQAEIYESLVYLWEQARAE
jgi:thiamine kinase-like enzyme